MVIFGHSVLVFQVLWLLFWVSVPFVVLFLVFLEESPPR